jgi:hypothetical protein
MMTSDGAELVKDGRQRLTEGLPDRRDDGWTGRLLTKAYGVRDASWVNLGEWNRDYFGGKNSGLGGRKRVSRGRQFLV